MLNLVCDFHVLSEGQWRKKAGVELTGKRFPFPADLPASSADRRRWRDQRYTMD